MKFFNKKLGSVGNDMNNIEKIFYSVSNVILMIFALIWVFPLYWGLTSSFKTEQAMFATPPQLFPLNPSLMSFIELFRKTHSVRWFLNSTFVAVMTMIFVCIFSSMAGYAFAKLKFRGRNFLFYFMISTMMLPKYVLLVPLFRLMNTLGWFDSFAGLIIPELAAPFGIFMMRQFIQTLPNELTESARIDGCNEFTTFIKIILPLTKPAIAALAIFTFVRSWNDYMWQLIVTKSEMMKTLPLGVAGLQQENLIQYGQMMAGATLSAMPMILIFIIFQKYFTRGITLGAVKG